MAWHNGLWCGKSTSDSIHLWAQSNTDNSDNTGNIDNTSNTGNTDNTSNTDNTDSTDNWAFL